MGRTVGALLSGTLLALALSGCSSGPVQPTADCADVGDPPAGAPGSAEVLLTVGQATGTRLLTTVLYADGWVLTLDGEDASMLMAVGLPMMAPSPPTARQWQPGYLGACQLEAVAELAADELDRDRDLGDLQITDQASTVVNYYAGEHPTATRAYALGHEEGTMLSRSEQEGREVLKGIIAALYDAPEQGMSLEVETVQLLGSPEVDLPADWPGPPLAEVIVVDDYCGELTGAEARRVVEYLNDRQEPLPSPRVEVMPPGLPTCA